MAVSLSVQEAAAAAGSAASGQAARTLVEGLGLLPVVARVLVARGVGTVDAARAFLYPSLDHLPDPLALPDMAVAVARVQQALARGERICVHGDYDADGTCAAALLVGVLRAAGADVRGVVPDRRIHGFGLHAELCRPEVEAGARLVITADVGAARPEAVAAVAALGCDVIVTDHHTMAAPIPAACAVVNPRRLAEPWPLCGAGVAFMLLSALLARLAPEVRARAAGALREALELATVATVADVSPLTGVNRTLVAHGLRLLERPTNPGLSVLKLRARLGHGRPTPRDLAFHLIPRLNALGRVGDSRQGLELLTTRDPGTAGALARECDRANRRRQRIQKGVRAAARAAADVQATRPMWVLAGRDWDRGVIGIVAGQLCAEGRRPVAVVAIEGDRAVGSARSIPGVDLVAALAAAGDLLESHGGHPMAAGFSCAADQLDVLRARLWQHLATRGDTTPATPPADTTATLGELDGPAVAELGRLAPFGEGNPPPRLRVAGVRRVGGEPAVSGDGATARALVHLRQDDAVTAAMAPLDVTATLTATHDCVLEWQPARPHWRLIAVQPPRP